MSILAHYTWNENDTSNTRDYTTIGNDSTAMIVTSIVPAEIGLGPSFNNVFDKITFGDIINVGGTDTLTIIAKIRLSGHREQVLAHKKDQWSVGFDAAGKTWLRITIGASTLELTSSATVGFGGDYKTIVWSYDGALGSANMKIYIDGTLDGNTVNKSGNLDASSSAFLIGTDLTDFYGGTIEMLSAYTEAFTQLKVNAIVAQPGGIKLKVPDSSQFSIGDLAELSDKGATAGGEGTITGILNATELLYLPLTGSIPNSLDVMRRRGNVFDTTRQWLSEKTIVSGEIRENLKDRVDTFSKANPSTDQPGGYKFTRSGMLFNTLFARDRMITPATLTVDQDDWNPVDATDTESTLATCNAINLSVSNPSVGITGITAPSPVVPQEIILTNVGGSNTSLANNNSSSLAINRFLHSGNVSINSEDAVTIKYDTAALRWRIISIT